MEWASTLRAHHEKRPSIQNRGSVRGNFGKKQQEKPAKHFTGCKGHFGASHYEHPSDNAVYSSLQEPLNALKNNSRFKSHSLHAQKEENLVMNLRESGALASNKHQVQKDAKQRNTSMRIQTSRHTPKHSDTSTEEQGLIQPGTATFVDLCPGDKKRVARLISELAELSEFFLPELLS